MLKVWVAPLAALFFCDLTTAATQGRHIALSDIGSEIQLSDIAISPDGTRIALVTSRADYIDNRFARSLILIDAASGGVSEVAPGRYKVTSPQWSADGRQLAWLDTADGGKAQIYVIAWEGNAARTTAVTSAKEGVTIFRWSPDGASFAFLAADAAPERAGEERHNKSFEVGDNDYMLTAAPVASHIWVVSAQGGEARRLSSGGDTVKSIEWLPEGRSIAYISHPRPHDGEFLNASLGLIDVTDGTRRTLITPTLTEPAAGGLFPLSPDGKNLAYVRPRGMEVAFRPDGIFLTPAVGGASRDIAPALDRNLTGMVWLPDGKAVLLTGNEGTRTPLWLQPLNGEPRRLNVGSVTQLAGLSMSRTGALAFIGSEGQRATELYFMSSVEAKPKRLTHFNDQLAALALGRVETVNWTVDGFDEDGVLIYPPGFQKGRKYPLVLNIHGGPMSASLEGFNAFNQVLAAQGWLIFSPNYRGSDSRGDKFQSAVINDAGDGPGRDVMAGIATLKARGIVDEQRIAVSGWSYGGYMTAWLTAHYQIWRAAVAGAAVTDWFDWYNMADLNVWSGYGLKGSPWLNDNAANYWRQSPMAYAHQIRTPTLILSNTGDRRVTISQSYKLYHALKDNGVPVQFIAYPIDGHWAGDPIHQRDTYRRWLGWIDERFRAP